MYEDCPIPEFGLTPSEPCVAEYACIQKYMHHLRTLYIPFTCELARTLYIIYTSMHVHAYIRIQAYTHIALHPSLFCTQKLPQYDKSVKFMSLSSSRRGRIQKICQMCSSFEIGLYQLSVG
jgi:hypothetical protein